MDPKRWNELFDTTLYPRLLGWLPAEAPSPVLLSKCLVRLSEHEEDQPQLEDILTRCHQRFGEEEVVRAVSRALPQLPPGPSRFSHAVQEPLVMLREVSVPKERPCESLSAVSETTFVPEVVHVWDAPVAVWGGPLVLRVVLSPQLNRYEVVSVSG